ncbi:MAG: hypothetical protein DRJ05_07860 [Bacteroidetes bacterium]|nr:MAG: hypothetical protein DRJ05_07860 [Bacteroidota bacterium]
MLNKFLNTKTLVILLIIVLGIYFLSDMFENEDRTFRSDLVSIDTAEITKIVIVPKIGGGDEISLIRTGSSWDLKSAGKSYKSDGAVIKNVLARLSLLKPERVAATNRSKWKGFEVTDSTSTRVKLYVGDKVGTEIYIGKFSYTQPPQGQGQMQQRQQQGKMSTHVRLAGEDEVYVVDGFLKMEIQANVDAYRDKTLVAVNNNDLTKLTFKYPDNDNFTLSLENNKWVINGMEADSANTAKYLQKLSKVTSNSFIDNINAVGSTPSHYVKFEGKNMLPVEIKAFPIMDTINKFVVTTSRIPDAKFSGGKNNLFENIFPVKEDLVKK